MSSILRTILGSIEVTFFLYLDDILLLGQSSAVTKAVKVILDSSLLINTSKSTLVPRRKIEYLGIIIDLDLETLALTTTFANKIRKEMNTVRRQRISLRYKQRLGGLINFARPILKLPLQIVQLAFCWPHLLYKFNSLIHDKPIKAVKFITEQSLFVDATPDQIAIVDIANRRAEILKSNQPILENEYIAVWLAHVTRPNAVIFSDNQAAIYLWRRGKLPPKWRNSYVITKLLIETYRNPILYYVRSEDNPSDRFSRVGIG